MDVSRSLEVRRAPARLAAAALLALAAPAARGAEPTSPQQGAPIALPRPASLADAVASVERATGARGEQLSAELEAIPLSEGRSFALEPRLAERLLAGSHATFLRAGLYLFRYERSYGLTGEKDRVGLLATADRRTVILRMGTEGPHRGITGEQIAAWLDALAKEEPFELTEIGVDYVAGRFARVPRDPAGLARRAAAFAPDLVVGHSDPLDGLVDLMGKNRTLYLIWD
jgi:hypothetical protein